MVKGETYNKQLFESDAFRHFINIFLNKQSGVTKGCEVTKDAQKIIVAAGCFVIQGGLLKETTGTDNAIPTEAGYYKLVYEIDLSKTNTKDEFKQGSYKFVKALGDYPQLTQEDLDDGGNIYQLPFCQFRITEQGIQDFKDIRPLINYGVYERKGEILWKNSNPTSPINANTTIKLSSEDYDVLKIFYKREVAQNFVLTTETIKGYDIDLTATGSQPSVSWIRERILTYVDNKTFSAAECFLQYSNAGRTAEPNGCIPICIVGYKTGIFD